MFRTYISVDFLIILHFPKVHVINHQRLPHGGFTLSQDAQHPLILREPEQDYNTVCDSKLIITIKQNNYYMSVEIVGDKV